MLRIAWSESYVLPLPPDHRFPMSKYELLPQQLLHEGTILSGNLFEPTPIDEKWIVKVHEDDYWERLKTMNLTPYDIRRTGFPFTPELIEREKVISQGTIVCTHYARQHGIAMNIAGGTHHAFRGHGEWFCLLNDQAMAAAYLLTNKLAKKILIVDLDVHQGNGTADIFRGEPGVFTFSIHGDNNYPFVKENSDLDIGMPDFADDALYLGALTYNLSNLIDKVQPDFIFYQAGVDILDTDRLGRLSVSRQGCRERDRIVLETAKRNRIPMVVCMGGGYSHQLRDIIEAHANTFRLAQEIFF